MLAGGSRRLVYEVMGLQGDRVYKARGSGTRSAAIQAGFQLSDTIILLATDCNSLGIGCR